MLEKKLKVVEGLDGLTSRCAHNFTTLCDHMNIHDDRILDLESDTKELVGAVAKLTNKCKHKASKLSLFMAVAAGIVYIVKNEIDKRDMKMKLIEQDKAQRFGSELESEGEAMDAAFI